MIKNHMKRLYVINYIKNIQLRLQQQLENLKHKIKK